MDKARLQTTRARVSQEVFDANTKVSKAASAIVARTKDWSQDDKLQALEYAWGGSLTNDLVNTKFVLDFEKLKEKCLGGLREGTADYRNANIALNDNVRTQLIDSLHLPSYIQKKYDSINLDNTLQYEDKKAKIQALLMETRLGASVMNSVPATSVETNLQMLSFAWGSNDPVKQPVAEFGVKMDALKNKITENMPANSVQYNSACKDFNNGVRTQLAASLPPDFQDKYDSLAGDDTLTYPEKKAKMLNWLATEIKDARHVHYSAEPERTAHNDFDAFMQQKAGGKTPPATAAAAGVTNKKPPIPIAGPAVSHLNYFSDELKSHPKWPNVILRTKSYVAEFKGYQGIGHDKLIAQKPEAIKLAVESLKIYSNLPPKTANAMAFNRQLANIAMVAPFPPNINDTILGAKTSYAIENSNTSVTMPGNQVSVAMRVPFMTTNGNVRSPLLLSVSAPALDTNSQPEWSHYVKDGKLDAANYRLALTTLSDHIRACAKDNPGHRVVLSAFGMLNFLSGLPAKEQESARKIGAEVFSTLISSLQDRNNAVVFSDLSSTAPFWVDVNRLLKTPIACVGKIPGDWIADTDMIVNAWDPNSVIGNGCQHDSSFDGYVGRSSLCHDAHALACGMYAEGLLEEK